MCTSRYSDIPLFGIPIIVIKVPTLHFAKLFDIKYKGQCLKNNRKSVKIKQIFIKSHWLVRTTWNVWRNEVYLSMSNESCCCVSRIRVTCVKGFGFINFVWPFLKHDGSMEERCSLRNLNYKHLVYTKRPLYNNMLFLSRDVCQRKMHCISSRNKISISLDRRPLKVSNSS